MKHTSLKRFISVRCTRIFSLEPLTQVLNLKETLILLSQKQSLAKGITFLYNVSHFLTAAFCTDGQKLDKHFAKSLSDCCHLVEVYKPFFQMLYFNYTWAVSR